MNTQQSEVSSQKSARAEFLAKWDECTSEQCDAFEARLAVTGTITGNHFDDLECMAVAYSRVCCDEWCCGWVSDFSRVPDWQERLEAKLNE